MNLHFDIVEIVSATMVLFAVIDIIGSVPIIINLRKKAGRIQSEKTAIVAGVLLVLFLFIGKQLLNLFGVTVEAFAVAGSFILFFLALEMIFPIVAGAGSLTTVLSLRAKYEVENIIMAIIINIIIVYLVLRSSERIEKYLGKQGTTVVHNFFGVILLAIAVNLFTTNIKTMLFTTETPVHNEQKTTTPNADPNDNKQTHNEYFYNPNI